MYNDFAYVYDELIREDIEYEKVCDFLENVFTIYDKNPNLVCDLACGTGNITIPMSRRGYDMIGVDVSPEMLDVARSKNNSGKDILYLCQDMKKLDLYGTCDAFLCMTDGFNYITSMEALKKIFNRIRTCFIEPDGFFIFDLSSVYKLKNVLGGNIFIYDKDDMFYTWENSYKEPFCRMELNFFKKDGEVYTRFVESQIQRGYTKKQIENLLIESGFSKVDVYGGYTFNSPGNDENRLVFVALP